MIIRKEMLHKVKKFHVVRFLILFIRSFFTERLFSVPSQRSSQLHRG